MQTVLVGETARPVAAGLAAGTAFAVVLGPLVQDLLFGVSAVDPRADARRR